MTQTGGRSEPRLTSARTRVLGLVRAVADADPVQIETTARRLGSSRRYLAPVAWVVISEIFPNRIRGAAMAVAVSSLWIACFILTYSFPILNTKLGSAGTFWLYAAICVAGFIFIKLKLPETKGKTLEQIERELVD